MLKNPQTGDKIRFNEDGLNCVYGSSMGLSHMKGLDLIIQSVVMEIPCDDADIWQITVTDPEIDQFILNSGMFDHSPNCERINNV